MKQLKGFESIRLCSDLHIDHHLIEGRWDLFEDDGTLDETLLVIAGDTAIELAFALPQADGGASWLETVTRPFHSMVMVLGNHDYWGMDLHDVDKIREAIEAIPNCYLLQNDVIGNEHVKIIGSTFWTDLSHPLDGIRYIESINDSRYITAHGRKLQASDINQEHEKALAFIRTNTTKDNPDQVLVVVTHHAPAAQSCDPRYIGDILNPCFFSHYDQEISYSDIDYWLHGHVHSNHDYTLGQCRVLCHYQHTDTASENKTLSTIPVCFIEQN